MTIKLLLTGGTIDKNYNESNGALDFSSTHIPDILALGRNLADVDIQQLMLKDSLDMDNQDRQIIVDACKASKQQQVVITHGTDTMVETARILGDLSNYELNKTVVLVGAMIPFVFKHSDAQFNLGFALAAVQTLSKGVYIAMNGKIFNYNSVIKNKKKGVFETK